MCIKRFLLPGLLTAALLLTTALACGHYGLGRHFTPAASPSQSPAPAVPVQPAAAAPVRTVPIVQAVTSYPICSVEGCTETGQHIHNGTIYCGYAHAGGWCDGSCHALCPVEGCTETGQHVHDGVTYCGYAHAGGWCDGSCRALCTVEGCTETGQHIHNGTIYCGYAHEHGWCDGSCLNAPPAASAPAVPSVPVSTGGHHGSSHHSGH